MSGYPDYLIPKQNSKKFTPEKINRSKVGRWHDIKDGGSIFGGDGSINAYLIDYHRFPRFSCNLIPPSNCKDLKIKLLNSDFKKPFTIGTSPPRIVESDFEYDSDREVIEMECGKIQDEKLPYTINNKEYVLTIEVVHSPLIANYSHCEFKLTASHIDKEVEQLSSSRKWQKVLITALRRMIEKYAKKCTDC